MDQRILKEFEKNPSGIPNRIPKNIRGIQERIFQRSLRASSWDPPQKKDTQRLFKGFWRGSSKDLSEHLRGLPKKNPKSKDPRENLPWISQRIFKRSPKTDTQTLPRIPQSIFQGSQKKSIPNRKILERTFRGSPRESSRDPKEDHREGKEQLGHSDEGFFLFSSPSNCGRG